jgi:zinc transporter ZupT
MDTFLSAAQIEPPVLTAVKIENFFSGLAVSRPLIKAKLVELH